MKRNGLVFVPREPPKRVILYPTQDSSSQQNQHQLNGIPMRPKTAAVSDHNSNEINANIRLQRQQPITIASKSNDNDDSKPNISGQNNSPTKPANPYYANPIFRPKVVTNQSSSVNNSTTTITTNTNSSSINVNQIVTSAPSTALGANRGRQPFVMKVQNPYLSTNGQTQHETETTVNQTSTQDDGRRWAHNVTSAPIARRTVSDERPVPSFQSSETNIPNPMNANDVKQKGTSATDIVISLMDTWRAPINPTNSSVMSIFARSGIAKDDSTITDQTSTTNGSLPNTPPYLTVGTLSTAANNNQNWKKALVANFQKNSRTNPTAKLFQSKQTVVPVQTTVPPTSESTTNQQTKTERTTLLNGANNERTFQANENTTTIPSLVRKTAESLRVTKQENNSNNNNVERSASLQIQPTMYSNLPLQTSTVNKLEENPQVTETSTSETTPLVPIHIPSALITAKPIANVDQQRAIITRVMIRRDFVKSTESKPPIPSAAPFRAFIPPQSAKPGTNPVNNVVQITTINENLDQINTNTTHHRIHPFHKTLQPSLPLSQKSLISFSATNSNVKESFKTETIQQQSVTVQQSNGLTNESLTSSSIMKMTQSQVMTTNGTSFRSTSLSAANADGKKRREELMNKIKKRATSASAASQDGNTDKDPFEIEDEEYEAEIEDESVRSSESDVDTDTSFALDPNVLLSDKVRRVGNAEVKSGFIPSLFANVPPTIRFCTETQRLEQLPLPLRKMMKWKMSSITPNIVKNTVIRSGFRLISVDEGNDWLGTWSRHMKPICFKAIREYQKVNHFPGSFQIGRKDRLWRNLSHMQAVHSRREFDFAPQTFVLPADFLLFKRVFEEMADTKESKWIIKPPASARGQGIRVISKIEHVPKKRPVIVQKYIANPYLINGHKFDLRLYVYVTSHDPLRIYLFDDGLTRFASRKYSAAVKSLSDRFMHLTNYSINRYNSEYKTNNDSAACTGHKWSLKALWAYLRKRDVDVGDILEKIKDLIIKTIISADSYVNVLTKANVRRKFSVHELFGFDVILDDQCKPYIVEVNISPSLHSNSPLDISVKGAMISDLLNLSGFMIPDRRDILFEGSARRKAKLPKSLIFDRRILPQSLSTDEKLKHQYFSQRYNDEQARKGILDVLTPDDLRILIESEDEFARRGSFERIYPTNQTKKYLKYFETSRYYNVLLNEWILKYNRLEERGIALLNSFCKKNIHLQNPSVDPNHMWTQYQKLQGHLSHRENDNNNPNNS